VYYGNMSLVYSVITTNVDEVGNQETLLTSTTDEYLSWVLPRWLDTLELDE
jgi:hypothetical protein